jgi:choline dehydrogenase-like flavoprotein
MHFDGRAVPRDTELTADLCIIGAGPACISMALELSGSALSVLILESGGFEPDPQTQALARGEVVGLPTFPLEVSRLRFFGGSTGHWGGFCRAFDPIDFETRPWVPHSGWPIAHAEVAQYYERAHELCQVGPPDYEPDQWELTQTPPLPLGKDIRTRLIQFSPPTRFGVRYRDPVVKAPNISLYLNSNVTSIRPDANGKTIAHVDVATLSGNRFTVKARTYVLAVGGIENARLLLASNQVMQRGIGNDHDLVGRYFGDHINLDTAAILPLSKDTSFELYSRSNRTVARRPLRQGGRLASVMGLLDLDPAVQRAERTLNYSAEVQATYFSDHFMHRERYYMPVQSDTGEQSRFRQVKETLSTLYRNLSDAVSAAFGSEAIPDSYYEVMSTQEQAPNPSSRVTLTGNKDALGMPMARLEWRLTDLDRHTIKVAARRIAQALGTAQLGRLRVTMDLDAAEWPLHMHSSWHHCGTTRMHADPRQGVVDANLRVHGLANLYVTGSSVFPTNSSSNPTPTVIALSVRLARHLKQMMS